MKSRIPAIAATLLTTSLLAAPLAQALESRIDAVTVYPRGADVTRVARVSLTPGANSVLLEGFPGDIDLGRLTAMVENQTVEVRSIRMDVREQRDAYDAEVRRLQAAITEVKDAIQAIDDEIAIAEFQLKFLEGLVQDSASRERREAVSGQADVASWQQAMDSIGSGAGTAMEKIRNARKSRRDQEAELSMLERELENKRDRREDSAVLRISLDSESSLESNLRVTYFQRQASWSSSYAAYLDTDANRLRLTHEAQVSQTSSEDWNNVELTLSTSNPGGAMQAPEQDSRFLDLYEPRMGARMARPGVERRFEAAQMLEEVVVSSARLPSGRYAVLYRASERASISNVADQAQGVPLSEYRVGVSLVTRTNPRRNASAFLSARYAHDSETPLLGGPMRVFVDGAFAGLAQLPDLLPGAEAVLPMGPDRQVEVSATDQGGGKGSEGFLTSRNTQLADFLFEVVNRHSRQTTVEVVDYYPVSRDERIEVSVPRSATKPDEENIDERPGVIVWRKTLEPGERWRIAHQYEVSFPEDTMLTDPL